MAVQPLTLLYGSASPASGRRVTMTAPSISSIDSTFALPAAATNRSVPPELVSVAARAGEARTSATATATAKVTRRAIDATLTAGHVVRTVRLCAERPSITLLPLNRAPSFNLAAGREPNRSRARYVQRWCRSAILRRPTVRPRTLAVTVTLPRQPWEALTRPGRLTRPVTVNE